MYSFCAEQFVVHIIKIWKWGLSNRHTNGARFQFQLHEDETDVCGVKDLGSVRQGLGPQFRGRVEGVPVPAGHCNFGPELLADQVLNFEGAVIRLKHIFNFFTFPEKI